MYLSWLSIHFHGSHTVQQTVINGSAARETTKQPFVHLNSFSDWVVFLECTISTMRVLGDQQFAHNSRNHLRWKHDGPV